MSDQVEVLYKVTDYRYAEYERSLLWNDKTLNIYWGVSSPILSDKDAQGVSFENCDKYE